MKYLLNGFSPKMLNLDEHIIKFEKVSKKEVDQNKKDCISAIGHHTMSKTLNVPNNRMDIRLEKGDTAYIIRSNKNNARKKTTSERGRNTKTKWIYQKVTVLT